MERCECCVHFDGSDYCEMLKTNVEVSDICSSFEPNDEYESEEGIPLATDEGYDVATV